MFKNKLMVSITSLLLVGVLVLTILMFAPMTASAKTINESYTQGGDQNVYIDYSGKGTVIEGNVADAVATVDGDQVNIPVYLGKYEAKWYDGWLWHGWSSWGTNNYKTNKDYAEYRGDTTTEYDVQSRKEYKYKRIETVDTYATKYYTKYQGTKWYNFWHTYTTSSWSYYGGWVNNYKIVDTWTSSAKKGTKNVTVYSDWRTSAPFAWPWESQWEPYTSRTTYRYRERTLYWNKNTNIGHEQVPLNYSLTDNNGEPISFGIKWSSNSLISEHFKTTMMMPIPRDECYDITYYYLDVESMYQTVVQALLDNKSTDDASTYIKGALVGGEALLSVILSSLSKQVSKNVIAKAFGQLGAYIAPILATFIISDIGMKMQQEVSLNDLIDALKEVEKYNYMVIKYTYFVDLNNRPCHPTQSVKIELVDEKNVYSDDIEYVSMRMKDNDKINGQLTNVYGDLDYFGDISYVKDKTEVSNMILNYFESYNVFDIWSWLGL